MTKSEATYFLEGLAAGLAAPTRSMVIDLYCLLSRKYGITADELEVVRVEIDVYLNEVEDKAS
jgi:hypothetical protein